MKSCIFIKTCKKDIQWLQFCLQSIEKFFTGHDELVIVADDDCRAMEAWVPPGTKMFYVPLTSNGYIHQQVVKLQAPQYTDADLIIYMDSDAVFCRPTTPESFMIDGKPMLLKTRYEDVGNAICWKPITEAVLGYTVEWEYMRRLPMVFLSSTVIRFQNLFPMLSPYLMQMTTRSFSEFNVLGAFAEWKDGDLYSIRDTAEYLPEAHVRQFWSWGGLTSEILDEIKEILDP